MIGGDAEEKIAESTRVKFRVNGQKFKDGNDVQDSFDCYAIIIRMDDQYATFTRDKVGEFEDAWFYIENDVVLKKEDFNHGSSDIQASVCTLFYKRHDPDQVSVNQIDVSINP